MIITFSYLRTLHDIFRNFTVELSLLTRRNKYKNYKLGTYHIILLLEQF